ncbi:interleukin-15 receptor subunit alpha isoform X3 [Sander vitreus]
MPWFTWRTYFRSPQSCQMDLGSSLFSVVYLLGAALCSNGDISCPCPNIPPFELTEPPLETCFRINSTFRYKCIGGYVRKVGTSNLIKCILDGVSPKWSTPTLVCIADPKRTTTQPPKSTVTTAASTYLQMTQSISTAAPATAGRDRTEPTSSGVQAQTDHSQGTEDVVTETKGTHRTTSTSPTAEPSSNSTNSSIRHGSTTTAGIGCASLTFVLAMIGISLYCYKRKSRNSIPTEPTEEQLYMNAVSSDPAS